MLEFKIADVVWVRFNSDEHVQGGIRPAVIIQNNIGNKFSPTIQVVPLTSRLTKSKLPTHVRIPEGTAGLTKESIAQCEGIRVVPKSAIKGRIGSMPHKYMALIAIASIISTPTIGYLSREEVEFIYCKVSEIAS